MVRRFQSAVFCLTAVFFLINSVAHGMGGASTLPEPGQMVLPGPSAQPAVLAGLRLSAEDPFRLTFLVRPDKNLPVNDRQSEYERLVRYFLSAMTVPNRDLWVNLSPSEGDRIISNNFSLTEMGRDLLSQDYVLKQLTSSLMHPHSELGRKFWEKIYQKAFERYGTTDVPVDAFQKVWIVPDTAEVSEHDGTAVIVKSRLKVKLDADHLSGGKEAAAASSLSKQAMRDLLLPVIEKEVNEGRHFAVLRQIYAAQLLATWFKKQLQNHLLGAVYMDRSKMAGIDLADPGEKAAIYQQYLKAYQKGVFNLIEEETDPGSMDTLPRKYFSGGCVPYSPDDIRILTGSPAVLPGLFEAVVVNLNPVTGARDSAQVSPLRKSKSGRKSKFEALSKDLYILVALDRSLRRGELTFEEIEALDRRLQEISGRAHSVEANMNSNGVIYFRLYVNRKWRMAFSGLEKHKTYRIRAEREDNRIVIYFETDGAINSYVFEQGKKPGLRQLTSGEQNINQARYRIRERFSRIVFKAVRWMEDHPDQQPPQDLVDEMRDFNAVVREKDLSLNNVLKTGYMLLTIDWRTVAQFTGLPRLPYQPVVEWESGVGLVVYVRAVKSGHTTAFLVRPERHVSGPDNPKRRFYYHPNKIATDVSLEKCRRRLLEQWARVGQKSIDPHGLRFRTTPSDSNVEATVWANEVLNALRKRGLDANVFLDISGMVPPGGKLSLQEMQTREALAEARVPRADWQRTVFLWNEVLPRILKDFRDDTPAPSGPSEDFAQGQDNVGGIDFRSGGGAAEESVDIDTQAEEDLRGLTPVIAQIRALTNLAEFY